MMNHEERLNRIFQKAEEKKRRKTIWTRTIAAAAVCLICTVSAVGVAVSDHRQELPTVPLTDSQTQTATPPHANAGQSAQQSTTDTAAGSSAPTEDTGNQAPSAQQPASEPTEPSLADPPENSNPRPEESQPVTTTDPDATLDKTEPAQSTTAPSTTQPDGSQTTQPSTAPGNADDEELLGGATQPATEDTPNLPPADTELEQPFYFIYPDSTEAVILSALNNGDSSLQGSISGISSPSQPLLLISRSFFEQYTAADDQAVLRAKMYIFAANNEQILAFLSENALSYNSSGDYYTVFITRSQASRLASTQMPENFRVLVTTF